jgi:hypothetical protein
VADLLTDLCTGCARCCDGSLFAGTTVTAAEAQRFGQDPLPQPCPQLRGKLCGIYSGRPEACAAYLCPAAQALGRGELSLEQARVTAGRLGR